MRLLFKASRKFLRAFFRSRYAFADFWGTAIASWTYMPIIPSLLSVQPMSYTSGEIFYMDIKGPSIEEDFLDIAFTLKLSSIQIDEIYKQVVHNNNAQTLTVRMLKENENNEKLPDVFRAWIKNNKDINVTFKERELINDETPNDWDLLEQ